MTPRLRFVLGKGGVGRTTMAASLGLRSAMDGHKTLVVELNGIADIGRRFGHPRSFEPIELAPNLDWRSLTMRDCLSDFGRKKLKLGRVGARLMSSRPLRSFIQAVPGLPDLLQLGKIENLLNEPSDNDPVYDSVIVDCPATGHGLSLLAAPRSMSELSETGPFHELAQIIATALTDSTTGIVIATLAERLPCNETVSLLDQLESEGFPVDRVMVNKVVGSPLPDRARWPSVRDAQPDTRDHRKLAELVDAIDRIADQQSKILGELHARTEAGSVPLDVVPYTLPVDGRTDATRIAEGL